MSGGRYVRRAIRNVSIKDNSSKEIDEREEEEEKTKLSCLMLKKKKA